MNNNNNIILSNDVKEKVIQGIDMMLELFQLAGQPLFPRKMTTNHSNAKMFIVTNKEQIIDECIKSDFLDCRINAYPYVIDSDVSADVIPPTIMFFDLDRNLFSTNEEFEKSATTTRTKIKQILSVDPTLVLWTGGGIHFYVVIRTSPLQRLDPRILRFCTELKTESSKEFLRFAEQYFTSEKCDPKHGPSIKSCLIRIPYTFNSKYVIKDSGVNNNNDNEQIVVLIHNLKRDVAMINENLVREFKYYLSDMKVKAILEKEEQDKRQKLFRLRYSNSRIHVNFNQSEEERYAYVEKLINSTISDNRYFVIWTLLAPYYRKIQGLTYEESEQKLTEWLDKCNQLKPVKNMKNKVYSALNKAHEFNPWGIKRIEEESIKARGIYNNILEVMRGA